MSYMALARKWRPRTFSQLVGQDHINKTLTNAITQQRLHHAYLFTGTRGVGKTSIARILAKALNCELGITAEPCLQCEACLAIEQGRFIDLIEIDGASKTRVEDTRELLDNVQYAPTSGRFKIYLIDEVHMLSQHSFNALLKTLEEPPLSVKFILATTDPQKLPVTVLSRCLQFNLKHLSIETIKKQLVMILEEEKLDYEPHAVYILAQAAKGSMRDALSLLDQAITSCETKLVTQDVKMILGYTQQDYAIDLLHSLSKQNAHDLLNLSQKIANEGDYFQYVLEEMLNYFHQIAIFQSIGDKDPLISPLSEVKTLAQLFSAEDIQLFYQIALKGCEEIHLAPTLLIGFNMTLLRMLTFRPATHNATPPLAFQETQSNTILDEPVLQLTTPSQSQPVFLDKKKTLEQIPKLEQVSPEIPLERTAITDAIEYLEDNPSIYEWDSIISKLQLTGLALNALINTEFVSKEGSQIILKVAKGHQSLFTQAIISRIESALKVYYQNPVQIILQTEEKTQTPAQHKKKVIEEKLQKAEDTLHKDPFFQLIQQEFSVEIVQNSIAFSKYVL